jgi:predicted  nucleic acid-binding Zn-ribbon protein
MSIASFLLVGAASVWGGLFRFSSLENKMIQLGEKIDGLIGSIQNLETKMEARFEKVEARFEKMEVRFERVENKIQALRLDLDRIDIRVTKLEQVNQKT